MDMHWIVGRTKKRGLNSPAARPRGCGTPVHHNGRRVRGTTTALSIPASTRPLEPLAGRRVLVLADVQNLSTGAEKLGFKFSYRLFGQRLRQAAKGCSAHAFFATTPRNGRMAAYFAERGWRPHAYPIHAVQTCRGTERRSNVDTVLAFFAGVLVRASSAEVIGVCSGDGQLVSDIAIAIAALPKKRDVVTFSLAGSTAWVLDATKNPLIAANVEIGRDVLHQGRANRWAT